jgi:D-sedoheptulose 7-phosphate isomerase
MKKEDMLKSYFEKMGKTLLESPLDKLSRAAELLMEARAADRWIFAAGNGGSAATASHFVNDFVKGLSADGKKRFKAFALNDCIPVFTALANDISYSEMFIEQLKNYASTGDVLVVYSGSGNSPNVVKAAAYAQEIGMDVIAFTGRDGGKVDPYCTVNCIAPTDVMEEIEDVHMVWEHAFITILRQAISQEDV